MNLVCKDGGVSSDISLKFFTFLLIWLVFIDAHNNTSGILRKTVIFELHTYRVVLKTKFSWFLEVPISFCHHLPPGSRPNFLGFSYAITNLQ